MTVIETAPMLRNRRWLAALFTGAAAMSLAMVSASTMGTLTAADELGPSWAGLPSAAGVVGTAAGAAALTALMARRGRRTGLVAGYTVGMAGGVLAVASATSVWLLIAGMVLLGVGNSAAQLSRYVATDLRPERPGGALAIVVWAGTLGAVGGPLLLAPVSTALRIGHSGATGVFLLSAIAVTTAALAATTLPRGLRVVEGPRTSPRLPPMRLSLTTMLAAQIVMTTIMTAAPVAIHQHSHSVSMVGAMISAHTFGMFALAPLSGLLCDRFGGRALIAIGLALLAISSVSAVTSSGGMTFAIVLFLLGYGWNLAYIGASSLIAGNLPAVDRMRLQGAVESRVWGGSAVATAASTAGFAAGGYGLLAVLSLALLAVPAMLLLRTSGSRGDPQSGLRPAGDLDRTPPSSPPPPKPTRRQSD
ncbi:MFS transporter [Nocardia sp. NEAU-G5]|uniref:MFS transporter n=1 Tax=Nocardia albiluteola TaxID=2842303 RepID=A0ABS6AXV2_9NOCA|nr:MFS transporter [Nocardia albiluteola]MBU3062355.1 MFS transporter [Nocardia albiluteola]